MITEQEILKGILTDATTFSGFSLAVNTLVTIMNNFLVTEGEEIKLRGARLQTRIISTFARDMQRNPEKWSYGGHFSEALFNEHYQTRKDDPLHAYDIMGSAIAKLDAAYGVDFQLEGAINYLKDIQTSADVMLKEMNKHIPQGEN